MRRHSIPEMLIVVLITIACAANAQSLYRYTDANGRVVYSDQPPPPTAKNVQPKQLPENVIETDALPFATRDAAERFPVTLYTFDCDVCKEAEALLAKRGVPFTTVIVTEAKGAARLKALTGAQAAPALQVGDKQVLQGYNAARWQETLDDAGYPKSGPPPRQQAARAASPPAAPATKPASAPEPAPEAAPAPPTAAAGGPPATPAPAVASPADSPKGGGYPK
jgi:glutaredoxin